MLSSIPPDLYQRLRSTLIECDPFKNNHALENIFIDQRISQWRDDLPQCNSLQERVEAIVTYLFKKTNNYNQNALVLCLHVLSDRYSSEDSLNKRLVGLASELEQMDRSFSNVQLGHEIRTFDSFADLTIQRINKRLQILKDEGYDPYLVDSVYHLVAQLHEFIKVAPDKDDLL